MPRPEQLSLKPKHQLDMHLAFIISMLTVEQLEKLIDYMEGGAVNG